MCKTWAIMYTCSHIISIRLSRCRGFYTAPKRNGPPKVACYGSAALIFKSTHACGPCEHQEAAKVHTTRIEDLKARCNNGWGAKSPELIAAEAEYEAQSYVLTKLFPGEQMVEKNFCPQRRRGLTRLPPSPLKEEVRAEELSEKWDHQQTSSWQDDWGDGGWTTLGAEIEEREAEKPEDVRECEAASHRQMEDWLSSEAEETPPEEQRPVVTGAWADEPKGLAALGSVPAIDDGSPLDPVVVEADDEALPGALTDTLCSSYESDCLTTLSTLRKACTGAADPPSTTDATNAAEVYPPPTASHPRPLRRRPKTIGAAIKLGTADSSSLTTTTPYTLDVDELNKRLTSSFNSARDSENTEPRPPQLRRQPAMSSIRRKSLIEGQKAECGHTCLRELFMLSL